MVFHIVPMLADTPHAASSQAHSSASVASGCSRTWALMAW
jgi:hypothetical protein